MLLFCAVDDFSVDVSVVGKSKLNGLLNISRDFSKQKSAVFLSNKGIRMSKLLNFSISDNERKRYYIFVNVFNK